MAHDNNLLADHLYDGRHLICNTTEELQNCQARQFSPCHVSGHWVLFVIDWLKKRIECYDSLNQSRRNLLRFYKMMIRDIHQKLGLMHGLHTMWYLLNKSMVMIVGCMLSGIPIVFPWDTR